MEINPDVIAVTENDPCIKEKKRQAERSGGVENYSPYKKILHVKTGQVPGIRIRGSS
jgi:hypothetical protein